MTEGMALDVRELEVSFAARGQRVDVLRGVSLVAQGGELVALTGASGAGKSTLLFAIAGMVPVQGGSIHVAGDRIDDLDSSAAAHFRLRHVGMVFQFFHLLPALSALENVALPLELDGTATKVARERAAEELVRLGLQDRLRHRPAELSGGEQQRVAIARATIARPSLLLADEPTGNLDDESARQVTALLQEIAAAGTTVVVATHDERIVNLAGRQVRLEGGRIADLPVLS